MYESVFEAPAFDPTASVLNDQIDAYKNALEAVEKDFIDYQATSEKEIDELNAYVEELRGYAERQKQTISDLEAKNEVCRLQIKESGQEETEMRANIQDLKDELSKQTCQTLELSIAQEESAHKSSIHGLENPRIVNNLGAELMYYKSLNEQLSNDNLVFKQQIEGLKTTIEHMKTENDELSMEINRDAETVKLSAEAQLRQQIYKSVILIEALGAPFDATSAEFAKSLREAVMNENYCRNIKIDFENSEISLDQAVEQYLSRGLYLMGLKAERTTDDKKPWREDSGEELSDGSLVNEDFETFQTLIRKNNVTCERLIVLQKDFQEMTNRAETAERRLAQLCAENDILRKINFSCKQILKTVEDQVNRDAELTTGKINAFTDEINKEIDDVSLEKSQLQILLSELQNCVQTADLTRQTVLEGAERMLPISEMLRSCDACFESNEMRDELTQISTKLAEIDFRPQIVDVRGLLEKEYGAQSPDCILQELQRRFEDFSGQLEAKNAEIEKRNFVIGLLVARTSVVPQSVGQSDFSCLINDFVRQAKNSEFYRDFVRPDISLDEQFIIIEQQKQIEGLTAAFKDMEIAQDQGAGQITVQFDEKLAMTANGREVGQIIEAAVSQASGKYQIFLETLVKMLLERTHTSEVAVADVLRAIEGVESSVEARLPEHEQQSKNLREISENLCAQLSTLATGISSVEELESMRQELVELLDLLGKQFSDFGQLQLSMSQLVSTRLKEVEIIPPNLQLPDARLQEVFSASEDVLSEVRGRLTEIYAAVCADRKEIQLFYTNRKTLEAERFGVAENAIRKLELSLRKCETELEHVRRAHVQMSSRDAATIASLRELVQQLKGKAEEDALLQAKRIRDLEEASRLQRQQEMVVLHDQIKALRSMCNAE